MSEMDRDDYLPAIADDFLIQVAEYAEKRIDAVIKIKQIALKVTNARDWTDQNGNPYLQASGSEKIANLFNISWRIDPPQYVEEADGHFTWTYKGFFSLGGRSIEVEGTRSSKDPFFNKYEYVKVAGQKDERRLLPPSAIDKGDVKKAAMTNLLGNGITRILGIRNLTWDDLKAFAGITQEQVTSIQYKKSGEKPPVSQPKEKGQDEKTESAIVAIDSISEFKGTNKKTQKPYTKYSLICADKTFTSFSETLAKEAQRSIDEKLNVTIEYKSGQWGLEIQSMTVQEPPEPESEDA